MPNTPPPNNFFDDTLLGLDGHPLLFDSPAPLNSPPTPPSMGMVPALPTFPQDSAVFSPEETHDSTTPRTDIHEQHAAPPTEDTNVVEDFLRALINSHAKGVKERWENPEVKKYFICDADQKIHTLEDFTTFIERINAINKCWHIGFINSVRYPADYIAYVKGQPLQLLNSNGESVIITIALTALAQLFNTALPKRHTKLLEPILKNPLTKPWLTENTLPDQLRITRLALVKRYRPLYELMLDDTLSVMAWFRCDNIDDLAEKFKFIALCHGRKLIPLAQKMLNSNPNLLPAFYQQLGNPHCFLDELIKLCKTQYPRFFLELTQYIGRIHNLPFLDAIIATLKQSDSTIYQPFLTKLKKRQTYLLAASNQAKHALEINEGSAPKRSHPATAQQETKKTNFAAHAPSHLVLAICSQEVHKSEIRSEMENFIQQLTAAVAQARHEAKSSVISFFVKCSPLAAEPGLFKRHCQRKLTDAKRRLLVIKPNPENPDSPLFICYGQPNERVNELTAITNAIQSVVQLATPLQFVTKMPDIRAPSTLIAGALDDYLHVSAERAQASYHP